MDRLVRNVIAALGERIDKLSWMQPETKVKAQSKLANFTTKIGYPDKRSEEHTSELQSLMRISYAVFCLKKKKKKRHGKNKITNKRRSTKHKKKKKQMTIQNKHT